MTTLTDKKMRAARMSVATATTLAATKLVVGIFTGSMAVISSAIDSLLDIVMSSVNFFAIRSAEKPADECHPFGHGKYETVATLIQAFVITLSGAGIIFESVRRLIQGSSLQRLEGGIVVLIISTAASYAISRYLSRVARETDSSALEADSLHFSMDIYTNLALAAGLVLVQFVQITWLDPALSIAVGLYILFEAMRLVRHGMRDVLDAELPPGIREDVREMIETHRKDLVDYRNLRTRRAGSQKFMDLEMIVCRHLSVEEAHDIADTLEEQIKNSIIGADVTIHIEPCRKSDCPGQANCANDKSRLS